MATLTLEVGTVDVSVTTTDGNATRILQAMLQQYGIDIEGMTGQEQATQSLAIIVNFIQAVARAWETNAAIDLARTTAIENAPTFE